MKYMKLVQTSAYKQKSDLCGFQGDWGNEAADALAKQALKHDRIMEVAFSKAESKAKIRNNIMKAWQKQWEEGMSFIQY